MISLICSYTLLIQEKSFGEVAPVREEFNDVKACPLCQKEFGKAINFNTICVGCGKVCPHRVLYDILLSRLFTIVICLLFIHNSFMF